MINKIRLIRKIFIKTDNADTSAIKSFKIICSLIVLLYHPDSWYKAAFNVYRFTRFLRSFSRNKLVHGKLEDFQIKRVFILNHMLSLLTRTGVPFYIPYEFNRSSPESNSGNLFCTTHLPLIKVCMKAMIENNLPIDAVVARYPKSDITISVWGMKEGIAALKSDGNVLLKVKSMLTKKSNIGLMVDDLETSQYSPNSMKVAKLTGSNVVFGFAKLNENGTISTWLENPPYPECRTDVEIEENILQLKRKTDQIFTEYLN